MHVVLLGATGFVGSAVLTEALARGHEVLAIARHPQRLPDAKGLVACAADINDSGVLASLIRDHDALISAFNPGWTHLPSHRRRLTHFQGAAPDRVAAADARTTDCVSVCASDKLLYLAG